MHRTFKYGKYQTVFLNQESGVTQLNVLEHFGYTVSQECYDKVIEFGNGVIIAYDNNVSIDNQQYYQVNEDYVHLLMSRYGKYKRGFIIPNVASYNKTTNQERTAKRLYFAGIVLLLEFFTYKQRSNSLSPDDGNVIHYYNDGTYSIQKSNAKEHKAYTHNFTPKFKWFDLNLHVCEDVTYNNRLLSLLHETHRDFLRLNLIQPKDYHERNNNTPLL